VKGYGRIIGLAVAAALLAVAYLVLTRTATPIQRGRLYTFGEGEAITEMTVTNGYGTFTFAKADGRWGLTQPGIYRVNQQKATVMEGYLLDLPVNRALPEERAEYGFAQPYAQISFVTSANQRQSVLVGNQTPSRSQVYLKDVTTGKIYVADLGVVSQFDGSLTAYRDKAVFSIDMAKLASLTYYKDGVKQLEVDRLSPQEWHMRYPYVAPARFIELNELAVGLRKWEAVGYPDEKTLNLAALGLDHPSESLEVSDASGRTQRLDFGIREGGSVYVRTGGPEDVVELFAVDVDFSGLTPTAVLFVAPLRTSVDRVAALDLEYGGQTVHLKVEQAAGQATSVTANGTPIPYDAFVSFFVSYIGLSAEGYNPAGRPGPEVMRLTTTFVDGASKTVRLLARDDTSLYMELDGKTEFYLSREAAQQMIARLEAALAATK